VDTDQGMIIEDEEQAEEPKKRGRGCLPWAIILGIIVLGGLATAPLIGQIILRTETPLPGEEFITDLGLRMLAVPGEFADRKMPGGTDAAIVAQRVARGQEVFKVECAVCHGNDGRGDGAWGVAMYPNAANFHKDRTQTKTDGQLFWLLAHGVNLTGMPAFGKDFPGGYHTDEELWDLIAYIRTLKNP
jgi:mono/diheme cytochrome c family protein